MTALISKISAAAQDVGGRLSADRTNKEQSYDYISADKILSVCGQALSKQGVMVLPQIAEQDTHLFEYTDQYGKARKRYDSRVDYNFTVTDGETSMMLTWFGMGSDYTVPDKAMYKAITSGHKYFLMKLLCVGAGNEDSEHETDEPAPAPKQKPAPAPVVKVRPAAEIVQELGYDPKPSSLMTLEMASLEVSSTGEKYIDMDNAALANRMRGIAAGLKKDGITPEYREELTRKQDAIRVILASRQ